MVWLIFPLIVVLSAVFYRLGGRGGAWWGNTKVRDLGVPLVCLGWLYFALGCPWWALFLCFGLMFGSLTTYWDYWGTDGVEWYEFALHGGMIGFALFPLVFFGVPWYWMLLRIIVLAVGISGWSFLIDNDILEEGGRGALIALTLPLLTLGG